MKLPLCLVFELERVVSLNTHEIVHTRVVVLCLFATIIHLLIGTVRRCDCIIHIVTDAFDACRESDT